MTPKQSAELARHRAATRPDDPAAVCFRAYAVQFESATDAQHKPAYCREYAAAAYRLAMPLMRDRQSIRDYISCVAQGVELRVWHGTEANQLLYAAQVALAALKEEQCKKPAGRPRRVA